jgi:hypothetical protein
MQSFLQETAVNSPFEAPNTNQKVFKSPEKSGFG